MKTSSIHMILIAAMVLLLAACSSAGPAKPAQGPAVGEQAQPQATEPAAEPAPIEPAGGAPLDSPVEAATEPAVAPEATAEPLAAATCASEAATQLGAAIASDYDFTSPEQVMEWFCAGAEFEDILVALETADQTGASAEEMLTMLAAGMTWEEIWQVVGLTGQP